MNGIKHDAGWLLGLILLAAGGLTAGCERNVNVGTDGPDPVEFHIAPSSVRMAPGREHVDLTVQGGLPPFRWVVEPAGLGAFDPHGPSARTVRYRRTAAAGVANITVFDSHTVAGGHDDYPLPGGVDGRWRAYAVIVQE